MVRKADKKKKKKKDKGHGKSGQKSGHHHSKHKAKLEYYHVLGIKYEVGKLCTFCTEFEAVFCCPGCKEGDGNEQKAAVVDPKHPHGKAARAAHKKAAAAAAAAAAGGPGAHAEFLCDKCDYEKHRHHKRVDHVRTVLNTKIVAENARLIKGLFQWLVARRQLLALCRATYRRFYDSSNRVYFYYNERTYETSWRKPYCLKNEELTPLPTPDYGTRKLGLCGSAEGRYCMKNTTVQLSSFATPTPQAPGKFRACFVAHVLFIWFGTNVP